eukprot:Cvel_9949.t1-p1 / transcript=Cvel_9949.t1 / gene=Cvel_9949 / organism=Chromera_velia_CCMP2878 / gene_product=hypothetical protein / transcript_product=hypothetical protein / location=Cvel_scaffold589:756-11120(-) / protein_length=931 / sequence_SO=supercontig / SO=protein_coding / is_pseudo=false
MTRTTLLSVGLFLLQLLQEAASSLGGATEEDTTLDVQSLLFDSRNSAGLAKTLPCRKVREVKLARTPWEAQLLANKVLEMERSESFPLSFCEAEVPCTYTPLFCTSQYSAECQIWIQNRDVEGPPIYRPWRMKCKDFRRCGQQGCNPENVAGPVLDIHPETHSKSCRAPMSADSSGLFSQTLPCEDWRLPQCDDVCDYLTRLKVSGRRFDEEPCELTGRKMPSGTVSSAEEQEEEEAPFQSTCGSFELCATRCLAPRFFSAKEDERLYTMHKSGFDAAARAAQAVWARSFEDLGILLPDSVSLLQSSDQIHLKPHHQTPRPTKRGKRPPDARRIFDKRNNTKGQAWRVPSAFVVDQVPSLKTPHHDIGKKFPSQATPPTQPKKAASELSSSVPPFLVPFRMVTQTLALWFGMDPSSSSSASSVSEAHDVNKLPSSDGNSIGGGVSFEQMSTKKGDVMAAFDAAGQAQKEAKDAHSAARKAAEAATAAQGEHASAAAAVATAKKKAADEARTAKVAAMKAAKAQNAAAREAEKTAEILAVESDEAERAADEAAHPSDAAATPSTSVSTEEENARRAEALARSDATLARMGVESAVLRTKLLQSGVTADALVSLHATPTELQRDGLDQHTVYKAVIKEHNAERKQLWSRQDSSTPLPDASQSVPVETVEFDLREFRDAKIGAPDISERHLAPAELNRLHLPEFHAENRETVQKGFEKLNTDEFSFPISLMAKLADSGIGPADLYARYMTPKDLETLSEDGWVGGALAQVEELRLDRVRRRTWEGAGIPPDWADVRDGFARVGLTPRKLQKTRLLPGQLRHLGIDPRGFYRRYLSTMLRNSGQVAGRGESGKGRPLAISGWRRAGYSEQVLSDDQIARLDLKPEDFVAMEISPEDLKAKNVPPVKDNQQVSEGIRVEDVPKKKRRHPCKAKDVE